MDSRGFDASKMLGLTGFALSMLTVLAIIVM
jgi:hypothetical protein